MILFNTLYVNMISSKAQQPDVGQGLPSGCRHRTELTWDSWSPQPIIPTADNPGVLGQLFMEVQQLRIGQEMQLIRRTVLRKTLTNVNDRLWHCLAVNGGHFEHILN